MNYAIQTYQMLKRGWLTARNWLRLECKSEGGESPSTSPTVEDSWEEVGSDSAIAILGDSPLDDFHPGGELKDWKRFPSKMCGSVDSTGGSARETSNRLTITQESYDAKMHYAKTTRKIDISTNSLIVVTRASYRRSYRRRPTFCEGQDLPAWMNSQED